MKRLLPFIFLATFAASVLAVAAEPQKSPAGNLIILANANDPESIELALYYARQRAVPESNIIALKMPAAETVSWKQFVEEIFNPLREILLERQWLAGLLSTEADPVGRRIASITGHKISYLVTTRGVPLKIAHNSKVVFKPIDPRMPSAYKSNGAALDSELALIAQNNTEIVGLQTNPLFGKDAPFSLDLAKIVKISRIDGGTLSRSKQMIDDAIAVEKNGLIGRSYVDYGGGPAKSGDNWFQQTAEQFRAARIDGDTDTARGTLSPTARFDRPALYFGWYSNKPNGPFILPETRFAPGAIALHIFSFSADTIRNPEPKRWCETLLARGATATFGNVAEPYLPFSVFPHLLAKSLLRGDTLGDAAAYATPVYSWQCVTFGDPLYRPFAISFEQQWENRDKLPPEEQGYLLLRKINALELDGERNYAIHIARQELDKKPTLPLALALAQLQQSAKDTQGELEALARILDHRNFNSTTAPLAAKAARRYTQLKKPEEALLLWKKILFSDKLPNAQRIPFLRSGIAAAKDAKDVRQTEIWNEELQQLLPPPPPPKPAKDAAPPK